MGAPRPDARRCRPALLRAAGCSIGAEEGAGQPRHRLIARPRRARLEDAPAIAAAHLAAWAENYGGLMPAEMLAAHDLDSRTQLWRHLIGTP
ncbi:MAG: hypothetical protein NZN45_01320, partial [Rhodovarius sp.]|nr:hypothetical protein [Rhodovarius sp.]